MKTSRASFVVQLTFASLITLSASPVFSQCSGGGGAPIAGSAGVTGVSGSSALGTALYAAQAQSIQQQREQAALRQQLYVAQRELAMNRYRQNADQQAQSALAKQEKEAAELADRLERRKQAKQSRAEAIAAIRARRAEEQKSPGQSTFSEPSQVAEQSDKPDDLRPSKMTVASMSIQDQLAIIAASIR